MPASDSILQARNEQPLPGHARLPGPSIDETEESFDQVLNRLWTGNSAGAVTVLSVIGSGKVAYLQIVPSLVCFTMGVAALGVAAIATASRKRRRLLGIEPAPATGRQEPSGDQRQPGRTDPRARVLVDAALASAGLFVLGMAWGLGLTIFILLSP